MLNLACQKLYRNKIHGTFFATQHEVFVQFISHFLCNSSKNVFIGLITFQFLTNRIDIP